MIAGIACVIGGLILLIIPEVRVRSGSWKHRSPGTVPLGSAYVLRGTVKNSVAGLYLVLGAASMIVGFQPPVVVAVAAVIWLFALLLGEKVQPATPALRPKPAPGSRPAPRPEATRPQPTVLTLALRKHLERANVTGKITYDLRYTKDEEGLQACRALNQLGYLRYTETGPGGSVEIYDLTDKGRAALG